MKKKLFVLLVSGFALVAACGDSSGFSEKAATTQENTDFIPEEYLGKTVEEYEAAQIAAEQDKVQYEGPSQPQRFIDQGFLELSWDDMVAPGYDADSIMKKYEPLIDKIEHGSDEALALYQKMDAEFSNAPANMELAGKEVSIPGFIAPLELVNGMITEFLLVPYFGACIHMPPPPSNQTLYVKVAKGSEISNDDSYDPIWVSGVLNVGNTKTDIGSASYEIADAAISKYEY